ncbi:putative hydrolase [Saccharomycopsis crataegensis]|uniref:Hydrolase n=1 Tax=Saccharomycopsis crataegensis TaxID=43959 RepID=A0AAV5QRC7_9ASCO|nr:putative hydrolase [Saccharomycopsis crataegensis]
MLNRHLGRRLLSTRSIPHKVPVHLEFDLHLPANSSPSSHNEPLILLHGLFGSKQNYKTVGKHLSNKLNAPIYAVDLRNHGDSPHSLPFDYSAMSQDIKFFVEEQGLNDVTIIGHSMGAKVAMYSALMLPKYIKRLVSVDNSPVSKPLGLNFSRDLEGMYHLEVSQSVLKTDKKWRDKGLKFLEKYEPDPKVRLFLISNYINKVSKFNYHDAISDQYAHFKIPVAQLHLQDGIQAIGDFPEHEISKRKFNGPSLFLKARNSDFITQDTVPMIYHYFPRTSMKTFPTGHWLISEQPQKFMETLISFIKST